MRPTGHRLAALTRRVEAGAHHQHRGQPPREVGRGHGRDVLNGRPLIRYNRRMLRFNAEQLWVNLKRQWTVPEAGAAAVLIGATK